MVCIDAGQKTPENHTVSMLNRKKTLEFLVADVGYLFRLTRMERVNNEYYV